MITFDQKQQYRERGYVVAPAVFSPDEVVRYRDHYMDVRSRGAAPNDARDVVPDSNDPLARYPRMLQMHQWDEISRDWMLEPRINTCLIALLDREPFAVQTMIYFKPPGARGQALHQDNYFLRVQPSNCVAAWMALDACDDANGCLQIVPGSHNWPLLCTVPADTTQSFTDITVPIPDGSAVHAIHMQPGDVLFFNGSVVHGSGPNVTSERFRRSLIGHYIEGDAQQVAAFYHPVLRMDGTPVELEQSLSGGACGVWVTHTGQPIVEMSGFEMVGARRTE